MVVVEAWGRVMVTEGPCARPFIDNPANTNNPRQVFNKERSFILLVLSDLRNNESLSTR